MASRYEIVNYVKDNHPDVAKIFNSDKEIYEWARNKYGRNSPSWDEIDKKFNPETAYTGTFTPPENEIQKSSLQQQDYSPEKFNWLERFLSYGGMAEEALGKGVLPESINVIKMISDGMGIDENYWEQSYNNSEAGLIYNWYTGLDKYTVDDFHEGGAKGALIDGTSFVLGMANPVGLGLFAVSGGASKIGSAVAGAGIKRFLINKGMQHNTKALAGARPFLRSAISQGFGSSLGLGTFFSAHGALGEASRQGKAIKAGDMDDYDYGEITKKAVEHGKEGLIIGGAIGVGISGGLGTRYGQLILKAKAEGKNLTRFENIQRLATHPIPRVGAEGAMFQFAGDIYGKSVRDEKAFPIFSPEWWNEYIQGTATILGIKMGGKLWGKVLGKPVSEYGEDADRILMEGLKDADSFSKGMEKSLENVKGEIGEVSPAVLDALDKKLISEKVKSEHSEQEYKSIRSNIKEMQSLITEFNEKGAGIGQVKMKRLSELSFEHNSMLTAILSDMKNNPDKAYDIISKITKKGALSEAEKKRAIKYVEKTLNTLNAASILSNASVTGGINIPKEGINTGIKSEEVTMDGSTNAKVDNKGNIIIYGSHVKIPDKLKWTGETLEDIKPKIISPVGETLQRIQKGIEEITRVPTAIEEIARKQLNIGENYSDKTANYEVLKLKQAKDLTKPDDKIVNYLLNIENTKDFDYKKQLESLDVDAKTNVEKVNTNALLEFASARAKSRGIEASKSDSKIALRFLDILKNRVGKDVTNMTVSDIKEATTLYQLEHLAKTGSYPKGPAISAISKLIQKSINKFYTNPDALPSWIPKDIDYFVEANKLGTWIPRPMVRDKALQIGNVLSKSNKNDAYGLAAELGSVKGLRAQEINSIMSSDVRDYNGKWLLNLKGREILVNPESGERTVTGAGKFRTIERDIWLGDVAEVNSLGSRLKNYLNVNKNISKKIVEEIGKKLPSDRKRGKFFDLRTSIQTALAENPTVTKDMINFFLGHDISRIDKSYVNFSLDKKIEHQKSFESILKGETKETLKKPSKIEPDISGTLEQQVAFYEKAKAREKEQMKILRAELGNAKNQSERMNIQGQINDLNSSMKATGMTLSDLKKKVPQKRISKVRPKEEIIFKSKSERDVALQNFMSRNKMSPETLKEAGLGKNEMGEFMDGAIKLAKGEWQPIDFFHENAHRLKYYAESNNNKKLLNMFNQGEKLAEGSKEYEAWLKKNPTIKNPVEEFFADVIASKGVTKEYSKGFVNKIKQWANRLVSVFKVAFNKGDYKDIARILAKPVQKGFIGKGGIKTGKKKFRMVEGIEISDTKEYVRAIKNRLNKMIEQYAPSVQDRSEVINIIAEDAGLKDFKLRKGTPIEDLETFYDHFAKNIPVKDIPKKINIATWFRNYRTAENSRLRANVSKEAQKEWLSTLGVSEGNIFRANIEQLKSYQSILHTMKYEKRSDIDWIDNKIMSNNLDPKIRSNFIKYGGLRQSAYPVHLVFKGMGLEKLSRKMIDHSSAEQGHIGRWIRFEEDAKKTIGHNIINKKWDKYSEFIYLFDRKRYVERKDAGKLKRTEKIFINKATTKEWRDGTNKSVKDMFTNTKEGKLGKLYTEFTKSYKIMFEDILSLHLNDAELKKWKEDNHVRWVEDNIYVTRQITDKFKKLYPTRGEKFKKFVESEAKILAEKEVVKRFGEKYTTEQYAETYDWANSVAWAELSDMFSFGGQKYSSKFLEKRNIKLPEFVEIGGKKIQVYETSYEKTVQNYATGMAKLLANLEVFPEFVKVKGFKTSDVKEVLGKLEAIHPKHGKWVKEQINTRLGIGESPTGDMANKFVKGSSKFAHLLSKAGLSFPTAGIKNILVGNTQTVLAFKVSSFARGMWDAMARDKRMSVKSTGATELGMRHLQEMQTFKGVKWLSDKVFSFGGMKPTENINRYVSVLAGRHDQARGIKILQRYGSDSKKYKKVAERFKDFYHLTESEIGLLRKYGMNGIEDVAFKSSVDKARTSRELDRLYQKMDSMAHINTQGASVDVFMPYWWNKGFVKPFTLYKRMAYAATFNTAANIKDAWKGKNFMKLAAFGFGTYYTGETLMAIQNAYLGTPFQTKDEDGIGRIGLTLWKGEFGGILSEFNRFLYSDIQIGFLINNAIGTAVDNLWTVFGDVRNIWSDMEGVSPKIKFELTQASADDYLAKTVSLYGNMKKAIMNKKSKYNTDYKQTQVYSREFARESGLEGNVEMLRHANNNYWDLFENAWNRSYMTGDKETFQRVYWLTFWGISNDYRRRGSSEDGIPIRTEREAMKQAATTMKSKMLALNPNKYTFTKKSKVGKMKALKYKLWLGNKKYADVLKIEAQFGKHYRQWKDYDLYDSMSALYLMDLKQYFK